MAYLKGDKRCEVEYGGELCGGTIRIEPYYEKGVREAQVNYLQCMDCFIKETVPDMSYRLFVLEHGQATDPKREE